MGPPQLEHGTSDARYQRCIGVLDKWAKQTWPQNRSDTVYFPMQWREKIASHAVKIRSIQDLQLVLGNDLEFAQSSLATHADSIVNMLKSVLEGGNEANLTPPALEYELDNAAGSWAPMVMTPSPPKVRQPNSRMASTRVTPIPSTTGPFSSFRAPAEFTGTTNSSFLPARTLAELTDTTPSNATASFSSFGPAAEFTGTANSPVLSARTPAELRNTTPSYATASFSSFGSAAEFTGTADSTVLSARTPAGLKDTIPSYSVASFSSFGPAAEFTGTAISPVLSARKPAGLTDPASSHATSSFSSFGPAAEFTGTAFSGDSNLDPRSSVLATSATDSKRFKRKINEQKVQNKREKKEKVK